MSVNDIVVREFEEYDERRKQKCFTDACLDIRDRSKKANSVLKKSSSRSVGFFSSSRYSFLCFRAHTINKFQVQKDIFCYFAYLNKSYKKPSVDNKLSSQFHRFRVRNGHKLEPQPQPLSGRRKSEERKSNQIKICQISCDEFLLFYWFNVGVVEVVEVVGVVSVNNTREMVKFG